MADPSDEREQALRDEFRRRFAVYVLASICVTLSALILIDLFLTDRRWWREQRGIYVTVPIAVAALSLWRYKLYYQAFRKKKLKEAGED